MIDFDITNFRTELRRFIRRFELSANGMSAWNYFRIYLTGFLPSLERKNCEAIALQGNVPVRPYNGSSPNYLGITKKQGRKRSKPRRIQGSPSRLMCETCYGIHRCYGINLGSHIM